MYIIEREDGELFAVVRYNQVVEKTPDEPCLCFQCQESRRRWKERVKNERTKNKQEKGNCRQ